MTFMLSEVLMHALIQINSPTQRAKLEHSRTPRYLRSITSDGASSDAET